MPESAPPGRPARRPASQLAAKAIDGKSSDSLPISDFREDRRPENRKRGKSRGEVCDKLTRSTGVVQQRRM
jgi:hypothetical protein